MNPEQVDHVIESWRMSCKRAIYWGTVQGVGFRAQTRSVARRFVVTGYVRNLPDGQVELIACGDDAEIERFLEAVAERMAGAILGHKIVDEPEQHFSSFEIRA